MAKCSVFQWLANRRKFMGKMNSTLKNSTLSIIPFSRLDKWYVSYYLNPFSLESKYKFEKLSQILMPIKNRISKDNYEGIIPVISKISFNDGQIHLRNENKTGMDLYVIEKGQLLVSKINFHQGAVAVNNIGQLVCSTHYQPYEINTDLIINEYLILALRSTAFLNYIKYLRADGIKNEATFEFIGGLEIPIPNKNEQNRIVKAYNKKIKLAEELDQKARELEEAIEEFLYDELGIKKTEPKTKSNIFSTISYKEVERWSVDTLGKLSQIENKFQGIYQLIKLREIINSYQYGLSERSSKEQIGYPMLRMNNINNSELDIRNLKYIKIDNDTFLKYKLNKGDLLFNRTNSKELVGKTALFEINGDYTFASYLIRVVVNNEKADARYINYLFNSSILQYQKDLVSRQITGQANINAQEMQDFLFPNPPLKKQKEIADKIESQKEEIAQLKREAKIKREDAINEFENEIFQPCN